MKSIFNALKNIRTNLAKAVGKKDFNKFYDEFINIANKLGSGK